MALASRLAALVKTRSQVVTLAYRFWRLDSTLANFFREGIYKALESPQTEKVDPDRVREAIVTLRRLYLTLDAIVKASKHIGLTNNSLTASSLRNIQHWGEEIMELVELVELSQNEELLSSIYARAAQEKERGELYDISQVKQ
jgi:hypothetical protein